MSSTEIAIASPCRVETPTAHPQTSANFTTAHCSGVDGRTISGARPAARADSGECVGPGDGVHTPKREADGDVDGDADDDCKGARDVWRYADRTFGGVHRDGREDAEDESRDCRPAGFRRRVATEGAWKRRFGVEGGEACVVEILPEEADADPGEQPRDGPTLGARNAEDSRDQEPGALEPAGRGGDRPGAVASDKLRDGEVGEPCDSR
jgi:hypothetical protein